MREPRSGLGSGFESRTDIGIVAIALRAQAELQAVVQALDCAGVPMLLLWGPSLRSRLHGETQAFLCNDARILVPRAKWRVARGSLERLGWRLDYGGSRPRLPSLRIPLWMHGFRIDLQWGLDRSPLISRALGPLERRLWAGGRLGSSRIPEPDDASLLVYLAVVLMRRAGQSDEDLLACARLVDDWGEVGRIARDARVEGSLETSLAGLELPRSGTASDGNARRSRVDRVLALESRVSSAGEALRETLEFGGMGFGYIRPRDPRAFRFAGLDIRVPRGVFEPRAITEKLVWRTLDAIEGVADPVVVEVGAGSGAVALGIAHERPDAHVHAVDISSRSIRCACANQRRLGIPNVEFRRGDMLDPLPRNLRGRVHALSSNFPYVERWSFEGGTEPSMTFYGSDTDGLGFMRALARRAPEYLRSGAVWAFQIGGHQWDILARDLSSRGFEPQEPADRTPGRRAVIGSARWTGASADDPTAAKSSAGGRTMSP